MASISHAKKNNIGVFIVENVSMDLDRELGTNMTLENAVDTSEETSILSSISPYILRDSDLIYASPPPPPASISSSVSGSNSSNGSSSNGANCMPLALWGYLSIVEQKHPDLGNIVNANVGLN